MKRSLRTQELIDENNRLTEERNQLIAEIAKIDAELRAVKGDLNQELWRTDLNKFEKRDQAHDDWLWK